jgi:hypothetical protein
MPSISSRFGTADTSVRSAHIASPHEAIPFPPERFKLHPAPTSFFVMPLHFFS